MSRALEKTEFWNLVMRDVYGPREGGVIIVIDAENARKGIAKTSAAVSLGDRLAWEFDYDLVEDDGVLSATGVFDRYTEQPGEEQPSVLVWDEAVGGGSGDARRSMSGENVKLGRAWQVLRTKRIVTITTLPNWGDLDSRLQKLADYRLWCSEWPIGEFKAYKVGTDFNGEYIETEGLGYSGDTRTIEFPDASADFPDIGDSETDAHPLYESLTERKEKLMGTRDFLASQMTDSDVAADGGVDPAIREELTSQAKWEESVKTAIRAVKPWDDDAGLSYPKAAQLVDYSREWVGNRVREWRDEYKHRELVEDPTSG